jgi:hypothetical protein
MTPTERQRSVLDALERHPFVAWVTRAQSGQAKRRGYRIHLCKSGTPDVIGFLIDGRFLGIETKVDMKEAAKKRNKDATFQRQTAFGELAIKHGAVYGKVSSGEEAVQVVERARGG